MVVDIDKRYELVKSTFETYRHKIIKDSPDSKYSKSIKILLRKQDIIEKLSEMLWTISSDVDNFYSTQVILRILIEHYLVAHYVFTKTFFGKNDTTGDNYYLSYENSEFLKRVNYEWEIDAIRQNKDKKEMKTPEALLRFSGEEISSIHTIAHQFDIRKIIRHLINQIEDKTFVNYHNILSDAVSKYNILSSYVHGGPSAEVEAFEKFSSEEKQSIIIGSSLFSKQYCYQTMEYIFFLLCEDFPEYIEVMKPFYPV